jgi:hypothetical protein
VTALADVLAYRNPDVVDRFCDEWDVERADAERLFDELLRWLWLCATVEDATLSITEPLLAIDEMWHAFVLFTVEYDAFCRRCFGRYLHHAPSTRADQQRERALWDTDPEAAEARWERRERAQYAAIFEHLGEATLLRWYVDLPTQFDATFFQTRRKVRALRFRPTEALRALRAAAGAGMAAGAS